MAKLTRKTQKIFGNNANSDQITAFGTAKTSNPVYTTDIDQIQSDIYLQGWTPSLMSDLAPYLQDSNALWFAITRQLSYIFQQGLPEWDPNTEYSIGSKVAPVGDTGFKVYVSKMNGNIGNLLTNTTYWKLYDLDITSTLQLVYPVGSIYISTTSTCPLASLFGTWEKVSSGRVLQGSDSTHSAGSTIEAGLPNITGNFYGQNRESGSDGCFYTTVGSWQNAVDKHNDGNRVTFNASRSSSVYGNSTTVQPPAFVVNIWKRTA